MAKRVQILRAPSVGSAQSAEIPADDEGNGKGRQLLSDVWEVLVVAKELSVPESDLASVCNHLDQHI